MQTYFNSIKVRLEQSCADAFLTAFDLFQFHKGTIRTASQRLFKVFKGLFQFHKGTIRTYIFVSVYPLESKISIP